VTQTPSFSDVNLDGIQPPPPATELPLAPPVPRTGPPASEIAERSGITHLRYVGLAMADYERALRFYERVWGLYRIADDGNPRLSGSVLRTPAGAGVSVDGVAYDGALLRVQVLAHRETPGLGDAFAAQPQAWLHSFRGRSLTNPAPEHWRVRKDGGDFDQFTGATITPRAIVNAVRRSLEFYRLNRELIFAAGNADRGPHFPGRAKPD